MFYETYGEFEVPRKQTPKGKVFDDSTKVINDFWEMVDQQTPGLSKAQGCYVFAIKASKGIKPWYVGQTKKTFKDECFQPQKKAHYNNVINNTGKGTPVMILVARHTSEKKTKLSKALPLSEANFVEQLLISQSLSANSELVNTKNTSFIKKIQIPGVLNSPKGKPSIGAKLLKSLLGIK
ncbi:MAG: hypothetical protein OXE44_09590 [Nitrospinae bacterium]|nr:hypothetical protein [Nitrospinota bacterium]